MRRNLPPAQLRLPLLALSIVLLLAMLVMQPGAAPQAEGATLNWRSVASLPQRRTEAQGGVVNGKLYFFGGMYDDDYRATKRSDVYDPANNTWKRIADMPVAITHAARVVDGETIYLIGGYVGNHPGPSTTRVLKYNTRTNSWSNGPALPAARGAGAAAIVGRKIHFFGGALRTDGINDVDKTDHYVLNLDTGDWSRAGAIPLGRNHLGAAVLNSKIYLIGGQFQHKEGTTAQSRVDVYNPSTGNWSRAASLPVGRSHIESSTLTVNGQIYVLGGSTNNGGAGKASADVFSYSPSSNSWTRHSSLPAGRKSPVAGYIDGKLIVAGGGSGDPTSTVWTATLSSSPTRTPTRTPDNDGLIAAAPSASLASAEAVAPTDTAIPPNTTAISPDATAEPIDPGGAEPATPADELTAAPAEAATEATPAPLTAEALQSGPHRIYLPSLSAGSP